MAERPNPHNPPGAGNGRTKRRNARRARAKGRVAAAALTGEQLRRGGFNAVAKVTLASGGYAFGYVSCVDSRVRVVVRRETPSSPKTSQIQVSDQAFGRGEWDAAAEALAKLGPGGSDG